MHIFYWNLMLAFVCNVPPIDTLFDVVTTPSRGPRMSFNGISCLILADVDEDLLHLRGVQ